MVHNGLPDSTIVVRGLFARPAKAIDSVSIKPGDSTEIRLTAGAPGTYFYAAEAGVADTSGEQETTGGAFVVDPVGGSPPDRIFVMNIWGQRKDSLTYRNALAINGRSWPNDERIDATVGDTVHWRWINANVRGHPMHMHGFFFRVDAKGSPLADTIYPAPAQRLAVTEFMAPFTTMAMTWSPDREGNWLFHCHIGWHVTRDATLEPPPIMEANMRMDADPEKHMAGLVLGLRIHPKPGATTASATPTKTLRLYVDEGKSKGFSATGMGYVLQQDARPPAADSVLLPGQVIVTNQGVPTDVVITNRLKETTSVHWHGLEIESYSDGVAGWSGMGKHLAPVIQPGDSFTAHLTLKRPGTFIYHTHMDDMRQMTSGLYGAVVVLEPGKEFDPSTDHVWVAGNDGLDAGKHRVVMNGDTTGPVLNFKAGVPHRMRFVNMGFALGGLVGVYEGKSFVPWRAIAKDGADLPAALAVPQKGPQLIVSGETYDYEWTPKPGRYRVTFVNPKKTLFSQEIVVR
jgi:FtsP/CotA-like multicopper oxidase with cupredoxin domain